MSEIYEDINEDAEKGDGLTTEDFRDWARICLSTFFKNKVDTDGNEINQEILFTERNISLVLNLDICNGMPYIYDAIELLYKKKVVNKEFDRKGKIPEDVVFIIGLLKECSKLSIPKSFITGIIAVYIEVCKGRELDI